MSQDPIGYGDGLNMYAYAYNDPVNFRDPMGLATCTGITDSGGFTESTCQDSWGSALNYSSGGGLFGGGGGGFSSPGFGPAGGGGPSREDIEEHLKEDANRFQNCVAIAVDLSSIQDQRDLTSELGDILGLDGDALYDAFRSVLRRPQQGRMPRATVSRIDSWFGGSVQRTTGRRFSFSGSNDDVSPWRRSMGVRRQNI